MVEESCASAAYYIASAADEIYVDKASLVGSIGVLMDGFGFTGAMEKLGIERRLLTAGATTKESLIPFSPHDRSAARACPVHAGPTSISNLSRWSSAGAATACGPRPSFQWPVLDGQQAVALGLAETSWALPGQVWRATSCKAEDLIDYTRRDNVAERLAKRFGAAVGESAVRTSQSLGWSVK